jgi:superfamily II DNA or RNA helicase
MYVSLTPQEAREYRELYRKFRRYLQNRNMTFKTHDDFRRFIIRTSWDKAAREALLARNRALNIALNSSSKIEALRRIIADNPKARILIFTQHNSLVYNVSREFLVPALTHKTEKKERKEILDRFRRGEYRIIVTSKLLDEGIDVPDATIGVILSGTGSGREFIQRLGRILRKQKGKKAHLIEIVSKETTETRISWRRRQRHIQDV